MSGFVVWKRVGVFLVLLLPLASPPANAAEPTGAIPIYGFAVVHAFPHDPKAFTEGLFYKDGFLYESTGLEGQSSVRKVRLETGAVVQQKNLVADDFGEGIVDWQDRLIGLTWKSGTGYVADLQKLRRCGGSSAIRARAGRLRATTRSCS